MTDQQIRVTIDHLADLCTLMGYTSSPKEQQDCMSAYNRIVKLYSYITDNTVLTYKQRLLTVGLYEQINQLLTYGMPGPRGVVINEIYQRLCKELYDHFLDELFAVEVPIDKLDMLLEKLGDIETAVSDLSNDVNLQYTGL